MFRARRYILTALFLGLLLSGAVAFGAPAFAQEGADEAKALDTISVTGSRIRRVAREEPRRDRRAGGAAASDAGKSERRGYGQCCPYDCRRE